MMWCVEWDGVCGILYEKRGELGGMVRGEGGLLLKCVVLVDRGHWCDVVFVDESMCCMGVFCWICVGRGFS